MGGGLMGWPGEGGRSGRGWGWGGEGGWAEAGPGEGGMKRREAKGNENSWCH